MTALVLTMMPVITKFFTKQQLAMDAKFFNTFSIPLGILLLALIGFCTRVSWKSSEERNSRETVWTVSAALAFGIGLFLLGVRQIYALAILSAGFYVVENTLIQIFTELKKYTDRKSETGGDGSVFHFIFANRRRFGAYVVHLAVVMMMVGFTGNAWNQKVEKTLRPGETLTLAGYTMRFDGLQEKQVGKVDQVFTNIQVTKNNKAFGVLQPAVNFYPDYTNQSQEPKPSYEVDVKGTPVADFYVSLSGWDNGGQAATFKVMVNYLVQWVWIGMWTLFFGTLFTLWPSAAVAVADPEGKGKVAGKVKA
jgi:cytochrome c-type biogenesis protein CcmF